MVIGTLQTKIHFPNPQSLKEKRMILKRVLSRFRNEFNAGIAELDGMDLWQESLLAVVCVGRERKEVDRLLNRMLNFLDQERNLRVVEHQTELL